MEYHEKLPLHAFTRVYIPREEFRHGSIPLDKLSDRPKFTYDYTDKEDVFRIRNKLRELGIHDPIEYRDNEDNLFYRYGIIRSPVYVA